MDRIQTVNHLMPWILGFALAFNWKIKVDRFKFIFESRYIKSACNSKLKYVICSKLKSRSSFCNQINYYQKIIFCEKNILGNYLIF